MKKLIVLLTLGIWLANYVACLSCTDHITDQPDVSGFSEPTTKYLPNSDPWNPKERIPAGCHCVCGLETFTFVIYWFPTLADLPALSLFTFNSDLAEQTRTDSIFHPPEA